MSTLIHIPGPYSDHHIQGIIGKGFKKQTHPKFSELIETIRCIVFKILRKKKLGKNFTHKKTTLLKKSNVIFYKLSFYDFKILLRITEKNIYKFDALI